ncbi:phytanoyl-CoA dioxygenase family protein [Nocardia rhamnosiphila]|uniref:Phytanoyl-CoA dioxygenase family protein n=1 Tax=Nocardia rhamnosiphila TaxID=426716 RepID=A0ABV2WRF4_9NOCA
MNTQHLHHVPADTPAVDLVEYLRRDGYVIVDNLVSNEDMDVAEAELRPYLDATPDGYNEMLGRKTRRTGALVARSAKCREFIRHPSILGTAKSFLGHASEFQLSLSQVISIEPGESAQALHRDESAWDFFPFPDDYHIELNTLWAMTDYTSEMGATRIVPGSSHSTKQPKEYDDSDCLQAEMERGSVLIYQGKIVHSGGANRTADKVRRAINLNYSVGWVRQEENQFLSVPLEVARTLDDDMLKLIGYQEGAWSMGYWRDFENPITAVRGSGYVPYEFDPSGLAANADTGFDYFVNSSI